MCTTGPGVRISPARRGSQDRRRCRGRGLSPGPPHTLSVHRFLGDPTENDLEAVRTQDDPDKGLSRLRLPRRSSSSLNNRSLPCSQCCCGPGPRLGVRGRGSEAGGTSSLSLCQGAVWGAHTDARPTLGPPPSTPPKAPPHSAPRRRLRHRCRIGVTQTSGPQQSVQPRPPRPVSGSV